MTSTAQDAATAAQQIRNRKIAAALANFYRNWQELYRAMPLLAENVTQQHVARCRLLLAAGRSDLDQLDRLIAQRDGMPVSDGPDTGERRYG